MVVESPLHVTVLLQVVSSVSTNPLLVVTGVPMIPVGLIALEAADLEGR